jgi:hypothetical protein
MYSPLIRVVDAFEKCTSTELKFKSSVKIGSVKIDGEEYGVRIKKVYDKAGEKPGYRCELKMEVPTSSGLLYVSIADFTSYTEWEVNMSPSLLFSDKFLGCYASPDYNFKSPMKISCGIDFILEGNSTEMYNAFERELFMHNIACRSGEVIDDVLMLDLYQMILDLLSTPNREITGLELLHTTVYVNNYTKVKIPYDAIAELIEEYNRTFQKDK